MAKKPRRKSTKKRAKAIKLNPKLWLRNAKDIQAYRKAELFEQEGKCAISGLPLDEDTRNPCLDHTHACGVGSEGKVRGVLLSEVNCLEGKYLKGFRKMKLDTKFGLDFPTFLINMGTYLKQSNEHKPLHYKFMSDYRDHVKRFNRATLVSRLNKDFNIYSLVTEAHPELVRKYMQAWVDKVEDKETK